MNMFYRFIILVFFLFFSEISFACSVPTSGPTYDSFIIVGFDDELSKKYQRYYNETVYVITIPVIIDPYLLKGITKAERAIIDEVNVFYRNKEDGSYVKSPLKLNYYENGFLRGIVSFSKVPNVEVEIMSTWQQTDSMCMTIGRKILKLEN